MLQIASSKGLLQSLFCSCLNPLLAVTETQLTKTSAALAENRTALPSSCSERTARSGSQGGAGWTMGWGGSRGSSKQVLEWSSSEDTGERLNSVPLSPSPVAAGAARWHLPCVCCTRAQTGARSQVLLPQRMHSKVPGRMSMALPSGPRHRPCRARSHQWGGVALRRAEQDVALSSWCEKGSSHPLHAGVHSQGCNCSCAPGYP